MTVGDAIDALTTLEAFGDHFAHLATTAEQRKLAASFNAFVRDVTRALAPTREEVGGDFASDTEGCPPGRRGR